MGKRKCENCWYWEEFNGVCCCSDSEEVADFTDKEFACKWHKHKDGDVGENQTACGEC